MCGIAGVITKDKTDISADLLSMLKLIQHRGPDASGIAIFSDATNITLRTTLKEPSLSPALLRTVEKFASVTENREGSLNNYLTLSEMRLNMQDEDIAAMHSEINRISGLTVHSVGRGIKVYKNGGLIPNLIRDNTIDGSVGTHGIGHVRMATESAEDINAAHPFVSPFYPDLAIVHNGQFTNYFNMRRFLEAKGASFKTMNDSEAASHLIAYAMRENGGDLADALQYALDKMDGIFCILAATSRQMGFVKDKLGIKPLLLFEHGGTVLMGSEQIEFTALQNDVFAEEMEPGEVRVWNI